MIDARRLAIGSVGMVVCTQLLYAQSAPHYRECPLGGDLASALAGVGRFGRGESQVGDSIGGD